MNERQIVMIKDLLRNLHPQSCSGTPKEKAQYGRGVLVAVVGMIQAYQTNFNFESAIAMAAVYAPKTVIAGCCPESWHEGFGMTEPQKNGIVVRLNGQK